MKQWFLKRKILKILNENSNKWFHDLEICEKLGYIFIFNIVFPKWFQVRKALSTLRKEGKIQSNGSLHKIERRYSHDRFLYK